MDNTIGDKIKQRRIELNLSQKAVADFLGISQQAYSKYEHNLNSFNFETALKLGEILNISLDALGLDFRSEIPQITLSDHEQKLVIAYRDNPDMQPAVDRLLLISNDTAQPTTIYRVAKSTDNHPAEITKTAKDFSKIPPTKHKL